MVLKNFDEEFEKGAEHFEHEKLANNPNMDKIYRCRCTKKDCPTNLHQAYRPFYLMLEENNGKNAQDASLNLRNHINH